MVQTNFSFSFIGIASWLELVKFWVTGAFDVHRQVKVFTYPKSELKWSVFLYTHDTNGAHLGATRSPNQNSWASLSSSFTTLYRSSEGSSIGGIWLLNAIKDVAERLHPDVSSWTGSNVQNAIFPYHSAPWDRDFHHSLRKCTGYTKKLDLSSMPKTVISLCEELTFPFLPSYTFVLDLEWCVWAPITKLLSGFRMMMSASDPSRIAPFRGYMLKIFALKRVE